MARRLADGPARLGRPVDSGKAPTLHPPASSGPAAYWFEAYLRRQDARQAFDDYIARQGRLRWEDHGRTLAGTPPPGVTAPSYMIVALAVHGYRHDDEAIPGH